MSRIDRALRIRESGPASAPADAGDGHPEGAGPLHQYNREERLLALKESRPAPQLLVFDHDDPAAISSRRAAPPHEVRPAAGPVPSRTPGAKLSVDADLEARLVTGTSSAVSVEQYRKVAAALHEEQVRSQLKTVIVTSALPGEGKTLTVVNLALTLSESYGRRVLVIDADLRGPALHSVLGVGNERGLCDALMDGQLTFGHVTSGLAVLAAGTPGRTPLAALSSGRMAEVLEECASQFDWVLIDTPPIGVLSDAQVLVRLAGAVLFVIGAGSTPAASVERAIAELGGPDAIFGVVLNRVEERRIPSARYYGRYQRHSTNT